MYKIIGADGNQYGPVSAEELRSWVRDNRANGETLVQAQGAADWKPLKTMSEFADLFAATAYASPPGAPAMPAPPEKVDDYLVWAILATLCCCLPAGIVGIVYAAQANSKKSVGDYAGAREAAAKAKTWTLVSFIGGLVIGVLYAIMMVVAGLK